MPATPSPDRPRLGVSVMLWRGGRVLLVRRARMPLAGYWALPGGSVELGERLADAARREMREETGLEVAVTGQIDTAEIIGKDAAGAVESHYVIAVFAAVDRGGEAVAGDDAAEARWVAPEEFWKLQMTADTLRIVTAAARTGEQRR